MAGDATMARKVDEMTLSQIRHLNACGLNDTDIGRRIGRDRSVVARYRSKLGLSNPGWRSSLWRQRIRQAARRVAEEQGFTTLNDFFVTSRRLKAARRGWPPEITLVEALDFLDALEAIGPSSRHTVAKWLGREAISHRVVPLLLRKGAIAFVGRSGYHSVYSLAIKRRPKHTTARPCDGLSMAILGA
jgi:hypothetical protein